MMNQPASGVSVTTSNMNGKKKTNKSVNINTSATTDIPKLTNPKHFVHVGAARTRLMLGILNMLDRTSPSLFGVHIPA